MTSDKNVKVIRDENKISVFIGEIEQSRIDSRNPGILEFEYMQYMNTVVSSAISEPTPIKALHIGGCGCALALAWETIRPNSRQLAIEIDPWIAEQARNWFPLPRKPLLRIRCADGLNALQGSSAYYDVIVRDAFDDAAVPDHLQTLEWTKLVSSHLHQTGIYLANCAHGKGVDSRPDIAAVNQLFNHSLIISDSKTLKGSRWGNIVVAGWNTEELIDPIKIDRELRKLPLPARLIYGEALLNWLGGASPNLDKARKEPKS